MSAPILKILVGSQNPVKINATKQAFSACFPEKTLQCKGIDAPSGVRDQPMNEEETRIGALNRVRFCQQQQADYYVAIEGGVQNFDYGPAAFAYVVIGDQQRMTTGRGANLPLPKSVFESLEQGEELGSVMDSLFNTDNIKQKGGAIGLLTHHLATRESNYHHALLLALAPVINSHLY